MQFEDEKHYNKSVALGRSENREPVNVYTVHWHYKKECDPDVTSVLKVECGYSSMQVRITPAQARELAANLLAHANEVEARNEQLAMQELAA